MKGPVEKAAKARPGLSLAKASRGGALKRSKSTSPLTKAKAKAAGKGKGRMFGRGADTRGTGKGKAVGSHTRSLRGLRF